jgi:hypothetical protein
LSQCGLRLTASRNCPRSSRESRRADYYPATLCGDSALQHTVSSQNHVYRILRGDNSWSSFVRLRRPVGFETVGAGMLPCPFYTLKPYSAIALRTPLRLGRLDSVRWFSAFTLSKNKFSP